MPALVSMALAIMVSQATVSTSEAQSKAPLVSTDCAWIAARDIRLKPLVAVCEAAWSMRTSLPNFVCDQTTRRKEQVMRRVSRGNERPRYETHTQEDVITAEVTYRDGDEEFNLVALNGRPATQDLVKQGTWTRGEFSPLVMIVLDRDSSPALSYRGSAKVDGTPVWVFDYAIEQVNNRGWSWTIGPATYYPAFRGQILIDQDNGRLRRLVQQASSIPDWLGLKSADLVTDYADVAITGLGNFHLPVKSKATNCWMGARSCSENVLEFHACRKFAAKTRILDVTQ